MKNLLILVLGLVACCSLLLGGCGGEGTESSESGSTRTASAAFTVVWPEPSRLIPIASRAIQVDVLRGTTKVASKTAARGAAGSTTTIKIENIPAGNLTFTATALPNVSTSGSVTTGSGVPQAVGSAPLKTEAGKTTKITLTMATTIVRLAIFPNPWQIKKLTPTVPARATAYDAQDRIVMTDVDEQFTWSTANNEILTISPNTGAIEGLTLGTTTITVKDKESGKTATGTVEVVNELPVDRVLLSPATLTLEPNASGTLTAQAVSEDGEDLEFTPDKFDWTSSDPTRATVDATGRVSAVADGTATIEAKEKITGKAATAVVTVAKATQGEIFLGIRKDAANSYGYVFGRLASLNTFEPIPTSRPQLDGVSRNGERTLYWIDEGGSQDGSNRRHLYSEKIDGSERTRLATFDDYDRFTYFPNADGTQVLLCIAPDYKNPSAPVQLDLIDVATGAVSPQPIPNVPAEGAELLAWSPDGERFVLGSVTRDANGLGTYKYYLVASSGAVQRQFETVPDETYIHGFHFSRSGSSLVYLDTNRRLFTRDIVVVDVRGGAVSQPPIEGYPQEAKFHPESEKLIYVGLVGNSTFGNRIFEMDRDGSNRRLIYTKAADEYEPKLMWDRQRITD